MKRILNKTLAVIILITCGGCEKLLMPDDAESSATATFDYMWRQVDERYALFDVKTVDWQQMYDSLRPQVYDGMPGDSLFAVLRKLLNSLDDGHVNLWGNNDVAGSETIYLERYGLKNFDVNSIALTYLRPDHHTTGGLAYNTIADGQVLYIRYASFSNRVSTSQLASVLERYPETKGVVFDIRQNGGGEIQNEWNLMAMLPCGGQLLYSTQMKHGPAHDDFTPQSNVYAPENTSHTPFNKHFILLTDRGCYSAASSFALCLKSYTNVVVMGDTTAGGLSIPAGGALPNGWYYRFGVSRTIAPDGINYENGVPPDHVVFLDPAATASLRDNIIDSACHWILSNQ